MKKDHLHTGRKIIFTREEAAKFAHWSKLLVLPGFVLHRRCRMGVS